MSVMESTLSSLQRGRIFREVGSEQKKFVFAILKPEPNGWGGGGGQARKTF